MATKTAKIQIVIAGKNKDAVGVIRGTGKELGALQGKITGLGRGLAGVLSVGAVVAYGKSAVASYDKQAGSVAKIKRLTGETAEDASLLAFATQQAGLDADKLATSWGIAASNIAKGKFDAAGIATKDGNGNARDFNAILMDTADLLADLPAGYQRTAKARELFGKGGADVAKILGKGSAAIAELRTEMEEYGLSFTDDNLKSYAEFKEAQRDMTAASMGLKTALAKDLAPALTAVSELGADVLPHLSSALGAVGAAADHIPKPVLGAVGAALGLASAAGVLTIGLGFTKAALLSSAETLGLYTPAATAAAAASTELAAAETAAAGTSVAASRAFIAETAAADRLAMAMLLVEQGSAGVAGAQSAAAASAAAGTAAMEAEAAAAASLSASVAGIGAAATIGLGGLAGIDGWFQKRANEQVGDWDKVVADWIKQAKAGKLTAADLKQLDDSGLNQKELRKLYADIGKKSPAALRAMRDAMGEAYKPTSLLGQAIEDLSGKGKKHAEVTDDEAEALKHLTAVTKAQERAAAGQESFDRLRDLDDAISDVADAQADLSVAERAAVGDSDEYRSAVQAEADDLRQLADDERAVTDAKADARQAQRDLNDARKEAKQRLDDLAEAVVNAADAERNAKTDAKRAAQELERANAGNGTALDKEEAANAAISAQHAAEQAARDHAEAIAENNAAQAAGIEGDKGVVDAKQKVADANQAIVDSERKVRDQQAKVAEDGKAKSKILADAALAVKAAHDKVNGALLTQAQKLRDVAAAQQGPLAGLQAYNGALSDLYAQLDPESPLAKRVAALLRAVREAISYDAPFASPSNPQQGTAIPPTRDPDAGPRSVRAGPGSITVNVINQGTATQVARATGAAIDQALDKHARATR